MKCELIYSSHRVYYSFLVCIFSELTEPKIHMEDAGNFLKLRKGHHSRKGWEPLVRIMHKNLLTDAIRRHRHGPYTSSPDTYKFSKFSVNLNVFGFYFHNISETL